MSEKDKLKIALRDMLQANEFLLSVDINERTLTHIFSNYLASIYPEYNVDCEYNRVGSDPKTFDNDKRVYPDIIIHKQNTKDNYIVIEAKKSNNFHRALDIEKLKMYKSSHLNYKHAFLIIFPVLDSEKNFNIEDLIEEIA